MEVQDIIAVGLAENGGSYKRLLEAFGVAQSDYGRFMDFLRHQRLKPREDVMDLPETLKSRAANSNSNPGTVSARKEGAIPKTWPPVRADSSPEDGGSQPPPGSAGL